MFRAWGKVQSGFHPFLCRPWWLLLRRIIGLVNGESRRACRRSARMRWVADFNISNCSYQVNIPSGKEVLPSPTSIYGLHTVVQDAGNQGRSMSPCPWELLPMGIPRQQLVSKRAATVTTYGGLCSRHYPGFETCLTPGWEP